MKKDKTQLILDEVARRTMALSPAETGLSGDYEHHTTISIANTLNMQRSNVSKVLNALVDDHILFKVLGKPILYFHKKIFEQTFSLPLEDDTYTRESLFGPQNDAPQSEPAQKADVADAFTHTVGYNDTLKNQVSLAKAAVTYPPMGLNTLLIGSTGCGKSTFAEVMYHYGMSIGMFVEETKFVAFNCADYAENPQLLVSQLFGSIKGAYTGADTEKVGLVDKADGGILFLDEVHRLPKEGQEMLFSLMDKGTYRRVGEANNTRRAQLMIIAATTEKKNSYLLNTFMRRIPITIELPDITEYSIQNRLELIYKFFYAESLKTKRRIVVYKKVLKSCLKYDCLLNIGGLKSDIQLLCAKGYFSCVADPGADITIKWKDIPNNMKMGFINTDQKVDRFTELALPETVIFDYSKVDETKYPPDQPNKYEHENKYYNTIIEEYYAHTLNEDNNVSARKNVEENLKTYFRSVHEKIRSNQLPGYGEFLSKVVDEHIVEAVIEAIDTVSSIYTNSESKKRIVCALSLHINNIIERMKCEQYYQDNNNSVATVEQLYPIDFHAAEKIVAVISRELSIEIAPTEVMFVTMLLHSMNEMDTENNIGVICIAHGNGVASSIAEVVNMLLEVDGLHALDMPLTGKTEDTLAKATEMVKNVNNGSGVVLLTDMGSLCNFDEFITEETGIPTLALPNVTTLMALEVTRRSYSATGNLQDFYNKLLEDGVVYDTKRKKRWQNTVARTEEDQFVEALDGMLGFLDARKIYSALNDVLANIWANLGISGDKMFEYKFIIHCAFMAERSIKKEPMPAKNINYYYENRQDTLEKVKQYFKPVCQQFGFTIEPSEYEAVIEIFDVNLHFTI